MAVRGGSVTDRLVKLIGYGSVTDRLGYYPIGSVFCPKVLAQLSSFLFIGFRVGSLRAHKFTDLAITFAYGLRFGRSLYRWNRENERSNLKWSYYYY